jgi:hypothetical protein
MNGDTYLYRCYGLTILSEIHCPELEESPHGNRPHVYIQRGSVPESLGCPKYSGYKCESNGSSLLIRTGRVAKLLISGGDHIFVEERDGAHDYEVRTLLLGWGIGAVLHQRGILPLHASAVATDQGCLAFCGPTGIGKSALAWSFLKRGYRLLDDNIAALKPDVSIPIVFSGYPEIKLCGDVLGSLKNGYSRIRPVLRGSDKFALDVRNHFQRNPQPLMKIYVLFRGGSLVPRMIRLKGGASFRALSENTFCTRFLKGMGEPAKHFDMLVKLADRIPIFDLQFPANSLSSDDLVQIIEDSFGKE